VEVLEDARTGIPLCCPSNAQEYGEDKGDVIFIWYYRSEESGAVQQ
jgi:hypothetical protein